MILYHLLKTKIFLSLIVFSFVIDANAQWVSNPAANTKLVIDQNDPVNILALDDKNEGVFVFWEDKKANAASDVYFIHADKNGVISFRADGKSVSTSKRKKEVPVAITDRNGNAYVIWKSTQKDSPDRLYIQKLTANGARIWGDQAKMVFESDDEIRDYSLDIDDSGRLYVGCLLREAGFTGDYKVVYQFVDEDGTLLRKNTDETVLYSSNTRKSKTAVVSDFENGAFYFWLENFSGKSVLRTFFIDDAGLMKWGKEPINISNINKSVLSYTVNRFGNSVYLSFQYQGQIKEIHHQLITRNGNLPWGVGGRKVTTLTGNQVNPQLAIIDSVIYLSWTNENRNDKNLFFQKFDKNGKPLWKKDGMQLVKSNGDQFGQRIIHDGKENLILAWIDKKIDSVYGNILVQKFDKDGKMLWDSLSVRVGAHFNSQKSYLNIIPDGMGGAITVFKERRNGKNEIYGQKIFESGTYASQILAFSAEVTDSKIRLSWYSANELPNVLYRVERSIQSDSGSAKWFEVGIVEANRDRSVNYYELYDVPSTGGTLYYRIIQKLGSDDVSVHDVIKVNFLESANNVLVPQNSPNPFSDSTIVSFYLPEDDEVSLEFFNSKVELIKEIPKQKYTAGRHEIVFYGDNLQPGIYFFRFRSRNHIEVKKMVLSPK